jgi:hypothetical protein
MTNELTAKWGVVGKVAVWLLLTVGAGLLALVGMVSTPQPAQGSHYRGHYEPTMVAPRQSPPNTIPYPRCGLPEEGDWVNSGSVDFISRIKVTCRYVPIYPKPPSTYPQYKGSWTVEVWAVYTGNGCLAAGQRGGGGGPPTCLVYWPPKPVYMMDYGPGNAYQFTTSYNHRFSTDYLYAHMSTLPEKRGQLFVKVDLHHKDPGQGVSTTRDWFIRR